jgi:hypothetical protein
MLHLVVWLKFTDVSEVLALIMEAASTSEMSVNFYQIHGATTQKTAIFKKFPAFVQPGRSPLN